MEKLPNMTESDRITIIRIIDDDSLTKFYSAAFFVKELDICSESSP